jgi:2-dehydropantoate 2-reductase
MKNQRKYRIAILGIGGVGGFLGALLSSAYGNTTEVEVIFITRGRNGQAIMESGLKLTTASGDSVVYADEVTDDPGAVGAIDLLICCVKAYDLESCICSLTGSITTDTVILPLLNGVDNTERIQNMLPRAKVLQGCIYVVSKLTAPGVVHQRGDFWSLHFGGDTVPPAGKSYILNIFKEAGINAVLEDYIGAEMWSKFSFISPVATYTSAYDVSIGQILDSEEHRKSIKVLMVELVTLAKALGIQLPEDRPEKNFLVMQKLPYEATSSMQADFASRRQTELETLTGYVVRQAEHRGIQLPSYSKMYQLLCQKNCKD